jgi:hypothetical protein
MHPGAPAQPVLAAWGITTQGSPMLLGLAPGGHEGHNPWAGFLGELVSCGLRAPLLAITDGAPGLIGAVEVVYSQSLRQRCLVHRARNLLARRALVPEPGVGGAGPRLTRLEWGGQLAGPTGPRSYTVHRHPAQRRLAFCGGSLRA